MGVLIGTVQSSVFSEGRSRTFLDSFSDHYAFYPGGVLR